MKTASILVVVALLTQAPAIVASEALEGQALHEMEVVDESQFRLEVEKTELEFHLLTEDLDEGGTDVEELLFHFAPIESFNPYLYDTERVECPLVPSFAARPVSRAPVAIFRTDFGRGADVVEWNLDITDYRGGVFRTFDGEGVPPDELPWDGRGDHDEVLKPGFPYSFLFTIEDSGTNRYQYAGDTFSLPFLSYQHGKNLRIEAAGYSLFQEKSDKTLDEAAGDVDRILRQILDAPSRALKVEAWAENLGIAEARAAWLAHQLEERLLLAEGQVAYEGQVFKGDPPGRDGLLRVVLLKGGKVEG